MTQPEAKTEGEDEKHCTVNCGGCACHIDPPCAHCLEHVSEDQ